MRRKACPGKSPRGRQNGAKENRRAEISPPVFACLCSVKIYSMDAFALRGIGPAALRAQQVHRRCRARRMFCIKDEGNCFGNTRKLQNRRNEPRNEKNPPYTFVYGGF